MSTAQLPRQDSTQPDGPSVLGPRPAPLGPMVERPDERQVAEVVDRLRRRYPAEQISRADLEGRVRSSFRQFSAARIRAFVGIFVERLVRGSIKKPPLTPIEARRDLTRR
jgi:hypothetical protein